MTPLLRRLALRMADYEQGVPHRVQHFLKVHSFALLIAQEEQLPEEALLTLEAAALVHDIGIRPSLAKYGRDTGALQEREGPPAARRMLSELGFDPVVTDRVCFLVGHHHTYQDIDGPDYQILVEADFLVNFLESGMGREEIRSVRERVFRTKTGVRLLDVMFLPEDAPTEGCL